MARVFISHAGKDAEAAAEVHRWLVDDGHEAFLDQNLSDGLLVGEEWEKRLRERLRWADAVVCVLTPAYLASVWCTAELTIAQSRGSRLLPVQAEPGVRHPLLNSVQYVDMILDAAAARAQLAEALLRVDAAGGAAWPDNRSPFPGLRPLDTDEHSVFFGRAAEIERLATLLRSPAERADPAALLIVGPSGCGKSSLVRAGLLPVMAAEPGWWTLPAILPGTQPITALARELAVSARHLSLGWTVTDVRRRLADGGLAGVTDDLLLAVPGERRRHLLIVVDQFEELLSQTSPEERASFADLLREAVAGPVQVAATLRPEFLDPLLASPELAGLATRTHTVRPLRSEALRAVIEGPADRAGIGIDAELVARLVADTGGGEALPLLAYALEQLSTGVQREGRLVTSRYEELGGVQGALARQADAALADALAAGGRSREQVIRELLRLVTVDEQGRPTRWRIRRDELPAQVLTELQPFIDRRLLTTDTERDPATDCDRVVLGIAHEAFLSAWPPLQEAITADATALRARRRVEQATQEWAEHGNAPARLWERGQLAAALADTEAHLQPVRGQPPTAATGDAPAPGGRWPEWLGRRRTLVADRVELSAQARNFLRVSIRRDRRRRGRAIAILSTLLVIALSLAAFAFDRQRAAEDQAQISTARQLAATAEAELGRHLDQSMLLAVKGYRLNPEPRTYAAVFNAATASPKLAAFAYTNSAISALATMGDGESVLVGEEDGTVASWSTRTQEWLRYGQLPHRIVSLAANSNRDAVVATDGYQVVLLRPGSTPTVLTTDAEKDLTAVALSPAADTVIYARTLSSFAGAITKQDVNTGTSSSMSFEGHPFRRLVVGSSDVIAFDVAYGYWVRLSLPDLHVVGSLRPGFGTHNHAQAMSDDGTVFSYTNGAESIPVWDTATSHDGPNATVWDANPTRWGRGPGAFPEAMALSPKGKYLATSDAGTVYVSKPNADPNATPIQWRLTGVSGVGVSNLQFLSDDALISAGQQQLTLWDFRQVSPIATFQRADVSPGCVACSGPLPVLSPDGSRVAHVGDRGAWGGIYVHNFSTGQDARYKSATARVGPPSWSPDGRYLLVPNSEGSVDVVASDSLTRVRAWPTDGLAEDVVAARYLDGNARFATATASGRVTVRNADTGEVLKTTPALPQRLQAYSDVRNVAINGQGTCLTLIGESGIYTVNLVNGTETQLADASARGIGVQYAGGRLVVSASSYETRTGWINIYSGADGTSLLRHIDTGSGMLEAGVASEGPLVAYQARDGNVNLIDSSDGALVGTFPQQASVEGLKTGLAFNEKGDHLVTVTAGYYTTSSFIEKWSVAPDALIRSLCRVAGRDLTTEEWQALVGDQSPDLTCH
jgi:WD40 repeat protein